MRRDLARTNQVGICISGEQSRWMVLECGYRRPLFRLNPRLQSYKPHAGTTCRIMINAAKPCLVNRLPLVRSTGELEIYHAGAGDLIPWK